MDLAIQHLFDRLAHSLRNSFTVLLSKNRKANFEVAFSLGMICGPTIGGFLFRYMDYTFSFVALTSLNLLAFIVCKMNFRHLQPARKST